MKSSTILDPDPGWVLDESAGENPPMFCFVVAIIRGFMCCPSLYLHKILESRMSCFVLCRSIYICAIGLAFFSFLVGLSGLES